MQVKNTFDLRTFQVVKVFFPRSGVHKIAKKESMRKNISSKKELT